MSEKRIVQNQGKGYGFSEENCEMCCYAKSKCVCNMHPLIAHATRDLYAIEDFIKFIDVNCKRDAVKISVQFQHKTFKDNTGFSVLNLRGRQMDSIVSRAYQEAGEQRKYLIERIKKLNEEESKVDKGTGQKP